MTQALFIFSFLVLISTLPASAQSLKSAEKDYIVVTVPEDPKALNKNKKLRSYRPHLYEDQSAVALRVTQTNKYPREIKKVRVRYQSPEGAKETHRFRRDTLFSQMRAGQAALVDELRRDGLPNIHRYEKALEWLNEGDSDPLLRYQWHTLAKTRPTQPGEQVSLRVKTGLFKKVDFTTDTVRITTPRGFPAIDADPCEPFDRFFARKQLRGYGIDKIKYDPYRLPKRKIVRQSFEVFFDKNQATLPPDQVQPIIDYLKLNNLSILDIRIEGYSSVEGDSLANARLHHRRANRLIALLQRYNNEPIARDTIIVAEAWDDFRKAIVSSPFQWLDTLSNADIRQRVNADESLRNALEPYLKPLRRGKISITLSDKFSTDDIIEKLFRDFNATAAELRTKKNSVKTAMPIEAKMLGMIHYLDALVQSGHVGDDVLASLVDECTMAPEARILLFYHIIKSHEERRTQDADNTWDSLFVGRQWNNLFGVAHTNIMMLIEEARSAEARSRLLRQAEDIQYYTIKYIEEGLLDPAVLCDIEYPFDRLFYGLKLNHYAMAYTLSERFDLPCYRFERDAATTVGKPKRFDNDDLLTFLSKYDTKGHAPAGRFKASFDVTPKGDYYFFIKTLFLSRDKSILDFVRTSDNFLEFDLFRLLRITVEQFDPVRNHYYDEEIQLAEMDKLIRQLRRNDKRICRRDVNQLYLDYYFKLLVYVDTHFLPGERSHVAAADNALHFISDYYTRRNHLLFPELRQYVVEALNSYYGLPTRKASTEYAGKVRGTKDEGRGKAERFPLASLQE